MGKYLKEIVFGVLFLIVVILIIGIIFYEFIPNQIIPEATKYVQTSDTAKLLTQIEEEKQEEVKEEQEEVLKSYEVTSDDLSTYSNQSQYVKGKNHPFFDYTSVKEDDPNAPSDAPVDSNTSSNSSNSTSQNDSSNSSSSSSNSDSDDSDDSDDSNDSSNDDSDNSSNNSQNNNSQNNNSQNSNSQNSNSNSVNTNSLRDTSDPNRSSK